MGVRWNFFAEFAKRPRSIGAIAPSSKFLARDMLEEIDFESIQTIVEFGPGTGPVSREIMRRATPEITYFAMETNPRFVEHLRREMPQLPLVADTAANVREHLRERGRETADAIVSGLPFSSFGEALQDQILEAILGALPPGGYFTTLAYFNSLTLPGGIRFHRKLKRSFSETRISKMTWLNLPPAYSYRCRK